MQLQPHFLFNTLNGIAALNYEDPKAANRMLAKLSDLLRGALDANSSPEVSLRQELDFNQRYLELEQIRLGDRLTLKLNVSPQALEASVPSLLLQPLLENAIRHAIAPYSRPGQILIEGQRENDRLCLQIRDTGPGISAGVSAEEGLGLSNTRARLYCLFGQDHQFTLVNASGGLVVKISFPFRIHAPNLQPAPISVEYENSHHSGR